MTRRPPISPLFPHPPLSRFDADVETAAKVDAAHLADVERGHVLDVALHDPLEPVAHPENVDGLEPRPDGGRPDDAVDSRRRPAADQDRQRSALGHRYTRVFASVSGSPNVSATAAYTTLPSIAFSPRNSAASSRHACFQPRLARRLVYGNVALVRARVEVRGRPPGILATA